MRDELKLKPCPSCESSHVRVNSDSGWVTCNNSDCLLDGPTGDSDGAKWNALPRRTDAPAGMSDGELVARAIGNGFAALATVLMKAGGVDCKELIRSGSEFGAVIDAEFDRRAAARKEATK